MKLLSIIDNDRHNFYFHNERYPNSKLVYEYTPTTGRNPGKRKVPNKMELACNAILCGSDGAE